MAFSAHRALAAAMRLQQTPEAATANTASDNPHLAAVGALAPAVAPAAKPDPMNVAKPAPLAPTAVPAPGGTSTGGTSTGGSPTRTATSTKAFTAKNATATATSNGKAPATATATAVPDKAGKSDKDEDKGKK